ncbi:MAG: glycosyltransferase [Thermodesulfobacteriota bacterium]
MISEIVNPSNIKSAEIVIGIPSYNEADSISFPVEQANKGLNMYFPHKSSVIVNVDNCSEDGTKEAFFSTPTKVPKIYASTKKGMRGKGRNIRNLLEISSGLGAKSIILIDADIKSLTPRWIKYFMEPLKDGYDFVVPIYMRHKYDGTITNNIAYPMLRTLFGLRIRQPIAGDFAISGRLADCLLLEPTWDDDIYNFGIDIWMTSVAICRNFKVCQAFLGSSKTHRPKDPASDLGPMFSQVVGTIFNLMKNFEYVWKDIEESRPSVIYGFGLGQSGVSEEVKIDTDLLHKSFISGFEDYGDIWKQVLMPSNMQVIQRLSKVDPEKFHYEDDEWARILFDFALASMFNKELDNKKLIEALIPLYYSCTLSFVNRVSKMDDAETELHLEDWTLRFEETKYYLMERWNHLNRLNGNRKLYRMLSGVDHQEE